MDVRDDMAGAFEQLEREIGREYAKSEAFADKPVDPVLMIERIGNRRRPARAMTKQIGWQIGLMRLGKVDREVSRDVINDMLMDRAVNGYEEVTGKLDNGIFMRGKFDNRLGRGLLDRLAEAQALKGSRQAQVQLIVQDFESFPDLVERGGKGLEAVWFFEARDPAPPEHKRAFDCELDRISAVENVVPDMLDEEPEVAAERLSVWFDEDENEWRTNFPKPADDNSGFITETGFFGDDDYERTLSEVKEAAHLAALARERQPWIDAAAKARDAWFGVKMAA